MSAAEKISTWQLAVLFQTYMTGSAIINIQGPILFSAQNGAWLSLLIANAIGFVILYLVLYINKQNPGLSYVEQTEKALGRMGSIIVISMFSLIIFYILGNIVYGMSQYFTTALMRETPLYVFNFLILFVAALTAKAGIEIIARMFHLLMYVLFAMVLLMLLLPLPIYEANHLLPIIPNGFKPIWNGVYVGFGFPYMDILYFSMILVYRNLDEKKRIGNYLYAGLALNGILLSITIAVSIMGLGPLAFHKKFPLHLLSQLISIGQIIERIEAIFGIALILGTYMKITMLLFILDAALTRLAKIKEKQLVYLVSIIVFFLSLTMYKNEVELGESGSVMQPVITFFLGFIPLVIVFIATIIRKSRQHSS
ncbi:endospore germination permease [Fictibacillus iocasae]|uniref:Endospore germination permease n=1 Tax=Fictibacillus iocasae TaxID=2715437 RepID=A0ABW2NUA6_9BACL